MIQNFKPGGLAKFGLDYESVRARRADTIYCSISGFGAGEGAGPARLRPARPGGLRADEPDRVAGRAAVPRRRRRLRRHDRPALRVRHPRGAASPRPDRPGPARRDEPAVHGAVDDGEPDLRVRRRRRRPESHGQRAPVAVPVRAAADRRRRPDRHCRQRRAVPQARRRSRPRGPPRRRTLRQRRNTQRQPRRAAADPASSGSPRIRAGVVRDPQPPPASRAGRSTTFAPASNSPSSSGSIRSSSPGASRPSATRCGCRRRRRATTSHRRSWTSTAPRSARGWRGGR